MEQTRFEIDYRMAAGESPPAIFIFDKIGKTVEGAGVTSAEVSGFLAANRSSPLVEVHLNTAGGMALEAIAIFNAIRQHPGQVWTIADGICASAGCLIFLAGSQRLMAPGSQLMTHLASLDGVKGNADSLKRAVVSLENLDQTVATMQAERVGMTTAKMLDLMAKETWLNADEAISLGFATGRTGANPQMLATVDLSGFRNVPAAALKWQTSAELSEVFKVDSRPVPAVDAGERFRIVP